MTHLIGRPLIGLNFLQERYEADFRFGLARLREYGEQVALLEGERAERRRLGGQFRRVIDNYYEIVSLTKRSSPSRRSTRLNSVMPYVIAAPFYFSGKIPLGVMTQMAGAFARVEGALSLLRHLLSEPCRLQGGDRPPHHLRGRDGARPGGRRGEAVRVRGGRRQRRHDRGPRPRLPDGRRIVEVPDLAFRTGETTLLTGPSGSGKSTLFRAIAGIWPFGAGRIGDAERAPA